MAFNPFIGQQQSDLEAALKLAQADLMAGRATIRAKSGDIMLDSQVDTSLQERIRLILKALNLLDPATYPIDQISMATQTRAVFGDVVPPTT